jgi:hypothetical protein
VPVTGHVLDQADVTGTELVHGAVAKPYLQFTRESDQPPFVRRSVKIHEAAALILLDL